MMFLFQDGADDRKNYEHNVINVCCAAGLLVSQDAICEVSATMVLSTSDVHEFHATVLNCKTRSFFHNTRRCVDPSSVPHFTISL